MEIRTVFLISLAVSTSDVATPRWRCVFMTCQELFGAITKHSPRNMFIIF